MNRMLVYCGKLTRIHRVQKRKKILKWMDETLFGVKFDGRFQRVIDRCEDAERDSVDESLSETRANDDRGRNHSLEAGNVHA